jgi:hypothetical protein
MPFSDRTQTQDETPTASRRAGLIRMSDDAGIEQGSRLERVFEKKIGAHEPALLTGKCCVGRKSVFHILCARVESLEQISVAPLEILQYVRQLAGHRCAIECQHPINDVVCPCLVSGIEIARLSRRLEGARDDSRRIGTHTKGLSIHKLGWWQSALGLDCWVSAGSTAQARLRAG